MKLTTESFPAFGFVKLLCCFIVVYLLFCSTSKINLGQSPTNTPQQTYSIIDRGDENKISEEFRIVEQFMTLTKEAKTKEAMKLFTDYVISGESEPNSVAVSQFNWSLIFYNRKIKLVEITGKISESESSKVNTILSYEDDSELKFKTTFHLHRMGEKWRINDIDIFPRPISMSGR